MTKHTNTLLIRVGAMVQRLENVTGNRVLTGSNPTEDVWELFSISFTPLNFASVFRKRLYPSCDVQVSIARNKIFQKGGKCVTCVMESIILPGQ